MPNHPERREHATTTRDDARTPDEDTPRTVVGRDPDTTGQTIHLGAYRARDGALGAPVHVDCEHPHAITVVGKRGSGKSHTLGVIAEGLATATGVTPIIVDPMGEFGSLATEHDGQTPPPRIRADALPARAWCDLLDLDPASPAGALIWRAATDTTTLDDMTTAIEDADANPPTRRAATNHLELAHHWNVFHPNATPITTQLDDDPIVIDCSTIPEPAANAICHAIATTIYDARLTDDTTTLPWLLLDEAHAFFDGTAAPALRTLLTRGRTPGTSLVTATQRPSALPPLVHSQTDLTIAHRLTNGHDRDSLATAHPTHDITTSLPDRTGDTLLIDDPTNATHTVHVRDRTTPHHGTTPRATEVSNTHLSHRDH